MARDDRRTLKPTSQAPRPESIELDAGDPEQALFSTALVRPRAGNRGLSIAALAVTLLLGLAVAKPWVAPGSDAPRTATEAASAGPEATQAVAATPGPTADTAADLAGPVCLGAGAWRIASLESWRDHEVRVWRAIEPIATATGPLDPAIPTAPAVGLEIRALGWCAPAYGPERPVGPARVQAWIVIDGVARDLELLQVLPWDETTYLAGVYVPQAPCPLGKTCPSTATRSVPQPWPSGRVVFRYDDLGAGTTVWFGVDAVLYDDAARASR